MRVEMEQQLWTALLAAAVAALKWGQSKPRFWGGGEVMDRLQEAVSACNGQVITSASGNEARIAAVLDAKAQVEAAPAVDRQWLIDKLSEIHKGLAV